MVLRGRFQHNTMRADAAVSLGKDPGGVDRAEHRMLVSGSFRTIQSPLGL